MTDSNLIRTAPCLACGCAVPYRTNARVCCDLCRLLRKREQARVTAEKKRRAAGVAPCKGVISSCMVCAASFVKSVVRMTRCTKCQAEFITQQTRQASADRRASETRTAAYNAWARERRLTDPRMSVTAHMRTLMHRGLKSRKAGRSWRTFVDYSLEELMSHLERQFLPSMSWANRSKWHIDHITPLASFQFDSPDDESFKQAWSLSNLRPIWGIDNVRKNRTRTHLI